MPALERALSALELVAQSRSGLTMAEVARRLALPRSSTHCLLRTLERWGYLHRNENTRRYLFGQKVFRLAKMALNGTRLRELAHPFLQRLMEATELTVHLAILERYEAVLIEKVERAGRSKIATWLGRRMDVHCTSTGKALIAYLPELELDQLIREHGLPRHNDNTIAGARRLKEHLALVRKQGYAVDDEEDELGFRCVGCPVFDKAGNAVAAVSVTGSISDITPENMVAIACRVRAAASGLSRALGFCGECPETQIDSIVGIPPEQFSLSSSRA